MGELPHLPVTSHLGATLNFETLERQVGELQEQGKRHVGGGVGAWTNPAGFSAKLEETASTQVRTESNGAVARLKGLPKTKEEVAAKVTLFTLPVGFRPPEELLMDFSDATAGKRQNLRIKTTGVVEAENAMTAAHFFSFNGITFNLT